MTSTQITIAIEAARRLVEHTRRAHEAAHAHLTKLEEALAAGAEAPAEPPVNEDQMVVADAAKELKKEPKTIYGYLKKYDLGRTEIGGTIYLNKGRVLAFKATPLHLRQMRFGRET